jgi:pyrrolysine biosynthesis protein PylC
MLGESGVFVPVGEQVLSMGTDYGKYYEEPGIEIFLCKGERPVFTLVFWGKDMEEADERKRKGLSILKENFVNNSIRTAA